MVVLSQAGTKLTQQNGRFRWDFGMCQRRMHSNAVVEALAFVLLNTWLPCQVVDVTIDHPKHTRTHIAYGLCHMDWFLHLFFSLYCTIQQTGQGWAKAETCPAEWKWKRILQAKTKKRRTMRLRREQSLVERGRLQWKQNNGKEPTQLGEKQWNLTHR